MMKRERKQFTIDKAGRILLKSSLFILMAMAVSLFNPIGSRAADRTITTDTNTSQLQDMGSDDILTVKGDVTLTVDEPLTIKKIDADSNLTITGNKLLTIYSDSSNCVISRGTLKIIDCFLNTTAPIYHGSIIGANGVYVENSVITACGDPCITANSGDVTIKNNSVINLSGTHGISLHNGTISISGAGTQVIIDVELIAMYAKTGISICDEDCLIITEPAGAVVETYQNAYYTIYESDGTTIAKKVTIKKPNNVPPAVNKPQGVQEKSSHTHSFSWQVSKYPTATSDGEEVHICSCGEIDEWSILPAISAFEEETIKLIKNAPANSVVTVETRLFNSFGIGVRDALAARPDVTLKVSFLSEGYKGQLLKVTIPAGKESLSLWDEKGWLGLCRAGSTLGYDNTQQ